MKISFPSEFESIIDVCEYFKNERMCHEFLAQQVWGDSPKCPHCFHSKFYKFSDGMRYKCAKCRKQFTAKVGTVFQYSKLPLKKWFMAIYLMGMNKKGISGAALARAIKVKDKTAWFVLHRIRKILSQDSKEKLNDLVLLDETFVGGRNTNRHKDKKVKYGVHRSFPDKAPVLGMLQPGGELRAVVVKSVKNTCLHPVIHDNIEEGTIIVTDEWQGYKGLHGKYHRETVDHYIGRFVNDSGFTTNPLESFWSHLKRAIIGVWHKVSRKHLQRYVDEIVFKYNNRKKKFSQMLNCVLALSGNKRLTYKQLVHGT